MVILLTGLVLFFALHPLDSKVDQWLSGIKPGGDLRREWHAWMQYGQGTCLVVVAILIWQMAPERRRILLALGASLAVMGIAVTVMKWMIGRPRPVLGDPDRFVGPLGAYPLTMADGSKVLVRAWQIGHDRVEQLWSMPSSHTAFAFCLSTFVAIHFPAIRWLAVFLALVVASGRLVFDAHYLTDVVVGAAVSIAVTAWVHQMPAMRRVAGM